jgi:hypothetical protein
MCSPLALAAVPVVIETASAVMDHVEQQKKSEENQKSAEENARNSMRLIGMRQQQEQQAQAQTLFQQDMEARRADAANRVQAGEAGVAGASVDALLSDIQRQQLLADQSVVKQTDAQLAQDEELKKQVTAQKNQQIASVPRPNLAATGLRIGGSIAKGAAQYIDKLPKKGGS